MSLSPAGFRQRDLLSWALLSILGHVPAIVVYDDKDGIWAVHSNIGWFPNYYFHDMGLVRYLKDGKPIERLLEFIPCENVSGEAICDAIISCLIRVGLDPQKCRSQTMDGAGNMAGKNIGAAARFKAINPKAIYHYCSSHDLNLAISKSCQLKEVQICLDALKKLGIFFKYSPKRSRRLEMAVDEVNEDREEARKIYKKKFKIYSETRWVEKHTTLQAFDDLYEPILLCLDAISSKERGWDSKAVVRLG